MNRTNITSKVCLLINFLRQLSYEDKRFFSFSTCACMRMRKRYRINTWKNRLSTKRRISKIKLIISWLLNLASLCDIHYSIPAFLPSGRYAVTARRYASAVYAVIVCPSVGLSVTSRSCTKMAKPKITQRTRYDSPGTLVCRRQKSRRNSNGVSPMGAPNENGVGSDRQFSTNMS